MIRAGRRRGAIRRATVLALPVLILLIGGSAVAGAITAPSTLNSDPVVLRQDVPVGVEHSASGAVAAADNYVAAEDRALLRPAHLRRVIETDWEPRAQAAELARPLPAAALAGKPADLVGLRLTAAVAAQRLTAYSTHTARVRVWDEITAWSPTLAPTQDWHLDTVALAWRSGRWLVASRASAPDAQTPVPSWTSGEAADRTSSAFDSRLAGMSEPYYGATP